MRREAASLLRTVRTIDFPPVLLFFLEWATRYSASLSIT